MRQIHPYSPRRRPAAALRDPARSLQSPGACCSLAAGAGRPGTRESRLLRSEHPRAPASDREAGERAGGRGTQLRGKGAGAEEGARSRPRGEGTIVGTRGEAGVTAARPESESAPQTLRTPERPLAWRAQPLLSPSAASPPRNPWRRPPPPPSGRCPSSVPPHAPSCEHRSGRCLHRPGREPPLRPIASARSESGARRRSGSSVRLSAVFEVPQLSSSPPRLARGHQRSASR